jgi:transposase
MVQKQQIIISYYRQGISQRQISQTLGINRKTVKKYILEYEGEKAHSRLEQIGVIQPPLYDNSNRSKRKLTVEMQESIDQYLRNNETKRTQGKAKQCMKAVDIHEVLHESGYQISYSTVAQYIRVYKQKGQEVFIRQHYIPGSCSEFDWGMVKLIIGGKQKNMMLAVFTLAHSNHRWAMLFYRQDMSSFLQAHVDYLEAIKGVPAQIVYDNMKTAVAKFTIKQSDKVPTNDLLKISSYYQFDYRFCNAAKGNEKGHVERSVEYIRRKAFSRLDQFDSLEQAQKRLQEVLNQLNNKPAKGQSRSINEVLMDEQENMIDLPVSPYEYAHSAHYRVDKYHTIVVDTNHYSIPDSLHEPMVEVKLYPHQIVIYNKSHQKIARHHRLHAKYQWCIDIDHYWKTMITKPGALAHSEALHQAPFKVRTLYEQYYSAIPQVFVQLCHYCAAQLIQSDLLIQATELTYTQSPHNPISVDKVKWNMIHLKNKQRPMIEMTCSNEDQDVMSILIEKECRKQLSEIQAFF